MRKKILIAMAVAAVGIAAALGVANLPQGTVTAVPSDGSGDGVYIGHAGPNFDEKAFWEAKTVEEMERVGLENNTESGGPSPFTAR